MKYSGDSEILHEIVRDTTRKSEKHELIRVVSQAFSCSISESTLHFLFNSVDAWVGLFCNRQSDFSGILCDRFVMFLGKIRLDLDGYLALRPPPPLIHLIKILSF